MAEPTSDRAAGENQAKIANERGHFVSMKHRLVRE